MVKEIKEIYEQVSDEVYPQIQGLETGLLYQTIQIILMEEQLQMQDSSLEVCNRFGIKSYAFINDDEKIIHALEEAVTQNPPIINIFRTASQNFKELVVDDKTGKIKWIVAGACAVVGLIFCIRYLNKAQQKKMNREQGVREVTKQPPPLIPAALCLVVPAHIVSNLSKGSSLSVDDLTDLIDNASYFLCTTFKKADSNQDRLEMTDEPILSDSQREVYIRINIDDGQNLIGKEIPYILKTNLPTSAQCVVRKLACLRNLTGLEAFNRI